MSKREKPLDDSEADEVLEFIQEDRRLHPPVEPLPRHDDAESTPPIVKRDRMG